MTPKTKRDAYILLPKLVMAVFIRFSVLSFENSIYLTGYM